MTYYIEIPLNLLQFLVVLFFFVFFLFLFFFVFFVFLVFSVGHTSIPMDQIASAQMCSPFQLKIT
jgi:hypothetical protein